MAVMRVNPTRMELWRLKKRLQVARRGYKLLKDKRDELMKQFLERAVKNKELRERVEERVLKFQDSFIHVRSLMEPVMLEEALMLPKQKAAVGISTQNIMSVEVPEFSFSNSNSLEMDVRPYGFAFTTYELDHSMELLMELYPDMIKLAQLEKSVQLISKEIEKTRRRVSALEYVLLPQLEETIKYISMKLEENQRENLTRLMKVKDIMLKRSREDKEQ